MASVMIAHQVKADQTQLKYCVEKMLNVKVYLLIRLKLSMV